MIAELFRYLFEASFRTVSYICDAMANAATRKNSSPTKRAVARGVLAALFLVGSAIVIGLICWQQ